MTSTGSDGKLGASFGAFLRRHRTLAVLIVLLVFAGLYIFWQTRFSPHRPNQDQGVREFSLEPSAGNDRYFDSLFRNRPEPIQEAFAESAKQGVKNATARSDVYFILHRYIDNGGNIYEIYDYVEAHPELAFMKEAEKLQPESFDRIKKRQLSFRYSDFGMYAYLGYLEILEKNGYANMAVFGTAANQYAKMAFYKKSIIEAQSNGEAQEYPQYSQKEVDRDREKALVFAEKASTLLLKLVTDPNSIADDSQSLDKVYASEQYASALRYLEALGASVSYKPNAMLSFIFSMSYAYKNVPELYLHVSLSNASTLLLKDSVPVSEIRNAVYPFLDIRNPLHKRSGIVERVLRSRLERGGTRFQEMDLYSWKNVSELGMRVPEFKSWLMENGWKNSDFK